MRITHNGTVYLLLTEYELISFTHSMNRIKTDMHPIDLREISRYKVA